MDDKTELLFLNILSKHSFLLKKGHTNELRNKKQKGWITVQQTLSAATGKHFDVENLKKKWNNIQSRVKENIRKRKQTGGGPCIELSSNDSCVIDILGESYPVFSQCPTAV